MLYACNTEGKLTQMDKTLWLLEGIYSTLKENQVFFTYEDGGD